MSSSHCLSAYHDPNSKTLYQSLISQRFLRRRIPSIVGCFLILPVYTAVLGFLTITFASQIFKLSFTPFLPTELWKIRLDTAAVVSELCDMCDMKIISPYLTVLVYTPRIAPCFIISPRTRRSQ